MKSGELLFAGARELGIELSQEMLESFSIYIKELAKWNKKINLTAIREERDILIKHVLDSLAYCKGFDAKHGYKLLDMGSGAGFPALPIQIVRPEIDITLVESIGKKASFLRHIVRTLKINAAVMETRIESLPHQFLDAFDIVTARAFAEMKQAISTGRPFIKKDGVIVLSRGPEETLNEQDMHELLVQQKQRLTLTLPFSNYTRAIWVFSRAA